MKIQPFRTLKDYSDFELKEKQSIFLAKAYPVSTEDEATMVLNDLKKKYYDASHCCFAYRLLDKSKFSDAGEPSGSAGIRILNAIDHFELFYSLVVIIRYFGGTKLGIGPLGKAYYSAAFQVLSSANIITKKPYVEAEIKLAISNMDKLTKILGINKIIVTETRYDSETRIKCFIPFDLVGKVNVKLAELFRGEVVCSIKDEIFFK